MIAIDNWELLQMVNKTKKAKFHPYPRPYKTEDENNKNYRSGKFGNTKHANPVEVKNFLAKLGHRPQGE